MHRTNVSLDVETMLLAVKLGERLGLGNRSSVIRYAVRQIAAREGLIDLAQEGTMDYSPTVYQTPQMPEHWVAEGNDGKLYLFPAGPNGWQQRTQFRGHVAGLRSVGKETARTVVELSGGGFDFGQMLSKVWIV